MISMFNKKKSVPTSYVARINNEIELTVHDKQTLLAAALEAGLPWPHHCQVGSCTRCKCKVKQGETMSLVDLDYVLTGEEIGNGARLACQTTLRSDISVEVKMQVTGPVLKTAICAGD